MAYADVARAIAAAVGGPDNVTNVWHCMTRLRFRIVDESRIDYDALKKIPQVMGTKFGSGQL
ncbi:MAG: PTS transporter subunit EIIB, partial [Olsenella sp.]